MAKSKHPKLLKAALADIADMNTKIKDNAGLLKETQTLCKHTIETANAVITGSQDQYKYLADVMESYVKKAVEIEAEEEKEAPDANKLDKLEKEADALRKEYNTGVKGIAALSVAMGQQLKSLAEAGKGYIVFRA